MFGKAKLDIPECEGIGPLHADGLSDELAMTFGRIAAMTLPDEKLLVKVQLDDGTQVNIGLDEHGRVELWDDERI